MGENLNGVIPKTISQILTEVSMIKDSYEKLRILKSHIYVLEQETMKIHGLKRQLPHCMLLLHDAIGKLKEELQYREREVGPVMEEFIPLKSDSEGDGGGAKRSYDSSDKRNWMSSAQLWSTPVEYENNFNVRNNNQDSVFLHKSRNQEMDARGSENQFRECSLKNRGGGAFLPFKKDSFVSMKEEKEILPAHGRALSLSMPEAEMEPSFDLNLEGNPERIGYGKAQTQQQQQHQRKQRRCWSPELHKRFVNALQRLGGPHVATPKQIRELMQVDGLTNDEVKSHLQKYRLHIRKLPTSSAGISNFSWLTGHHSGDMARVMATHSGSPQGPLHAKGGSVTCGDSMEEEDDLKSESHSWKGRLNKSIEGKT